MSGKETFFEMKKIKPDVKVLCTSGFRQDDRVQKMLDSGAVGFIQKPYSMEELGAKIKEFLT